MRTAQDVLSSLADTLAFLDEGVGSPPPGSPIRHQIIARALAVAAYGQGIEDDLAAARLGRVIDESSWGLLDLKDDPAQEAVLDFLYEIGLKAAAGFPEAMPEGLTWKD
jgi:hypothetical protein